jgi:tetratricopeptide (TPR) repeat protein
MSNVFDLQDRMTESVVGAIEPKLEHAEIERLKQRPAGNLNAYDWLLRAQQHQHEFTQESFAAAIKSLGKALAIDPTYASAMAMKAYLLAERRHQGWAHDMEAEAAEGHRLAARAVELAGDEPNVLWMAAHAIRVLGRDLLRGRELHRRSLLMNPNSIMALIGAAWNETLLSNSAEALDLLRRAERISPRDPRAWIMAGAAANAHLQQGQFKDAVDLAEKALALNPRSTRTLRILAASFAGLGERERAADVIRRVLAAEPGLTIAGMRTRLNYWPEVAWNRLAEGLRLAGLPE